MQIVPTVIGRTEIYYDLGRLVANKCDIASPTDTAQNENEHKKHR